jgi:hypothetical protein
MSDAASAFFTRIGFSATAKNEVLGAGNPRPTSGPAPGPLAGRQPAVLPRPPASPATCPPRAARDQAESTVPAAGPVSPAGASAGDPVVWQRGDKFARGQIPDGAAASASSPAGASLAPEAAAKEIWVEGHPRKLPEPPTLVIVLREFRLHENRPLALGRFVAEWLAHQPDRPADGQLTRAEALRTIRDGLVAQQQLGLAGRLDRFLCSFYVARELGWQAAWKLRYAAIRELLPLFGRNAATEEYELRPRVAAATKDLWARMERDRLTGEQVRAEVRRLLPRRTVALHGAAGRLAMFRRELARLKSRDDLLAVLRLVEERLALLGQATTAKAG